MNIWQWVNEAKEKARKEGNHRLADLISNISASVCNSHKIDLIYPELLSMVKKHKNPWLEVFVRHWYLQNQLFVRRNAKVLPEAVYLLDLSSKESTKDCPQSICAVQDLTVCYTLSDGKGYAEERIAVAQETLNRIDESWDCYKCIGEEYVSALIDADRAEEARDELFRIRKLINAKKDFGKTRLFAFVEFESLIALGKYQEAEKFASWLNPINEEAKRDIRQVIALALCLQQEFKKASDYELRFDEIKSLQSYYFNWSRIQWLKTEGEEAYDYQELNSQFNYILNAYFKNGCWRDLINVSEYQCQIALKNKDCFTIDRAIERLKVVIPNLAKDLGAAEQLVKWQEIYKKLLSQLEDALELEQVANDLQSQSLSCLSILYKKHSKNLDIALAYFDALLAQKYVSEANKIVPQLFDQFKEHCQMLLRTGSLLIEEKQTNMFDRLFDKALIETSNKKAQKLIFELKSLRHEDKPEQALSWLQKILAIEPGDRNVLAKAAKQAMKLEDYALAQEYYQSLLQEDLAENKEHYWDSLMLATIQENWRLVRKLAVELGFKVDQNDLPFDESFGHIRIQIVEENGNSFSISANREGPAHACITGIRSLGEQQYFGQTVVFYPQSLNKLDQKDDDGNACDSEGNYSLLFPCYKTIKSEEYFYFSIDGAEPDAETWDGFLTWCKIMGITIHEEHSDGYTIDIEEVEYPAIYLYCACPASVDIGKIHEKLLIIRKKMKKPLIWPILCSEVGDQQELELQAVYEEEYDLD